VLASTGDLRAAAGHLARAVELAPGRPEYRRAYAETLKQLGRYTEALAQYEAVLAARPDDVNALLNAAWMRATLPDARARDGAEAVRMAEHARDVAGGPVAVLEAACAAAYAEAGRWGDAIAAADRAVERARAGGSAAEADEYARQRAAYRAGRPWRGLPR
jgi:tetratricopeptide (TPR) repeat protein